MGSMARIRTGFLTSVLLVAVIGGAFANTTISLGPANPLEPNPENRALFFNSTRDIAGGQFDLQFDQYV